MGSLVCLQAQDEFGAAESKAQNRLHPLPCPGLWRAPAPALKKHASLRGQGAGDTGPHGMENTPGAHT